MQMSDHCWWWFFANYVKVCFGMSVCELVLENPSLAWIGLFVSEVPYANVACNPLTLPANITGVSALIQPLGLRDREYCFWMYYPHLGSDIESVVNEKVRTLCSARYQVVKNGHSPFLKLDFLWWGGVFYNSEDKT